MLGESKNGAISDQNKADSGRSLSLGHLFTACCSKNLFLEMAYDFHGYFLNRSDTPEKKDKYRVQDHELKEKYIQLKDINLEEIHDKNKTSEKYYSKRKV